jgi:hypothetical protein
MKCQCNSIVTIYLRTFPPTRSRVWVEWLVPLFINNFVELFVVDVFYVKAAICVGGA